MLTRCAFVGPNPTEARITSGLPVLHRQLPLRSLKGDSFQRLRIFLLKRPRSFIEGLNGTIDTRK